MEVRFLSTAPLSRTDVDFIAVFARKWFNHDPAKWDAFNDRYFRELDERPEAIERLLAKCREGTVTLIFGAKDTCYNNAVALKAYLKRRSRK